MTSGKMLAEGIGTFALVFAGVLAIVNGAHSLEIADPASVADPRSPTHLNSPGC